MAHVSNVHRVASYTSTYSHKDVVVREIKNSLANFKDMRLLQKSFTYNNGSQRKLACLDGTIPIQYKSKTYNIPLIVWLPEKFPSEAPIAFVQPTETMSIKPGHCVDNAGRVTVPYLKDWVFNSEIQVLLQILQMEFGENPPVFAKKSGQNNSQTQYQRPPYPANSADSSMPQTPYPTSQTMPTPYPPAPSHNSNNNFTGYPPTTQPSSGYFNPYGPKPPYPTGQTGYGGYGQGAGFGYPSQNSGYPQYPQQGSGYPNTSSTPYPAQTEPNYTQNQSTPYPPATVANPPSYNPYSTTTASSTPSTQTSTSSYGDSDAIITESLRSAVAAEMKKIIQERLATNNAELQVLRQTETNLQNGKQKLDKMLQDCSQEQMDCEVSIVTLRSQIEQLEEQFSRNSNRSPLNPEDAVVTAVLFKQLMTCFAEEQAIEDTLYKLGEALSKEKITLIIYLKKVRDLSRKLFSTKLLIQKCREKAGLSDIYA